MGPPAGIAATLPGVVSAPEDLPQAADSYRQNRFQVPPDAAELLLIRHGESEPALLDAPAPLLDGQSDPALAREGRAQAELVAARLAPADIDAIYVSTLRRTAETAAPLAARLGLVPRVEAGLREVGLGEWEGGLFRKMVSEHHPAAMKMWAQESFEVIPGAEPAAEFAARVREAVGRLAAAHTGHRVAVFTHGGVIGQALALASGSRPFAFVTSDNGSISRLVVSGERWIVRGFNDTAHLEPPSRQD
jgi:2,3-bisphosphoglycerate-dependent phosphoglycerate mutase